jgi:protein SCO1/2
MNHRRTVLLASSLPFALIAAFAVSQWPDDPESLLNQQNKIRVESLTETRIDAPLKRHSSVQIPDVQLTDDKGRSLRLYSDLIRERSVCINFFYTQCNGSCPGTTMVIRKVREELADQFSPEELVFVSISLDPEADNTERLAEYRSSYRVSSDSSLPEWVFATCSPEDLQDLRRALGAWEPDPVLDADRSQHAATLTFGNDRLDRWSALPAGMNREQLGMAMCRIMGNTARQRYSGVARLRMPNVSAQARRRQSSTMVTKPDA